MKLYSVALIAMAAATLATCTVRQAQQDLAERRSAQWQRMQDSRAYSEFLRGRYAALTNAPHAAASFYAAAAKNEPQDRDILERATFTSLIADDVQTALTTAKNAPATARTGTALPNLVLAVDAIVENKPRRAEKYLELNTNSLFNNLIANSLKAWAAYDLRGLDAGIAALGETPDQTSLLGGLSEVTKGLMQLHAEQQIEALTTFEAMWDNGFRLASTTEMHAKLLAASGRNKEAIELLTTFGQRVGQNAAIEDTRRALLAGEAASLSQFSVSQGAALSVYTAAATLAAQKDGDLAGVYFALALHLDEDLHVARTLWANSLDAADRRGDAIDLLLEVPGNSVFYSTARGQLAWALRREGRNEEALRTASEALELSADRNLKIQLGDLFRSLGNIEQAAHVFTEVIDADTEKNTQDWRLYYARGAIREQLEMWPEGEADLLIALDLAPRQPALLNYLGYSWIDRGEHLEQSLEMIKTAVALRPNAGFIVDSLGWAHYQLGDYEQAVQHLERAVELSPSDADLNYHLGDAYWQVGRKTEAKFQWKRVLKIDPDHEDAASIRTKLENGLPPTAPSSPASSRQTSP